MPQALLEAIGSYLRNVELTQSSQRSQTDTTFGHQAAAHQ